MILSDRFDTLINCYQGEPLDFSKIENFFENLIKNNQKIYLPKYVLNSINRQWNPEIVENTILKILNEQTKLIRKNLRSELSRNSKQNIVDIFNSLILKFSNIVNEVSYFVKDCCFVSKCFGNFLSKIISDPLVQVSFTNNTMDTSIKFKTKNLFEKIKKLDENFYKTWHIPFLKNCINNYKFKDDIFDFPVPKKVREFYNFNENSKLLISYTKHFDFIENIHSAFSDQYENIINSFELILKENNFINIIKFLQMDSINKNIDFVFKNVESNIKEESMINIIYIFLEKFIVEKSFESLIIAYLVISKKYVNLKSSSILLSKEISKCIDKLQLHEQFVNIMINLIHDKEMNDTETLSYLFSIINYLDDKNIIFKKYHQNLMLRLLQDDTDESMIEKENSFLFLLTKYFNPNQRYKLKKTIEDVKNSIESNNYIKGKIMTSAFMNRTNNLNFLFNSANIILTSFNVWDTLVLDSGTRFDNTSSNKKYKGLSNLYESNPYGNIYKFFSFYSHAFNIREDNERYLLWYLHTGMVSIDYSTRKGLVELELLPLQALVLENFDNDNETLKYSDFLDFIFLENYSRKEKESILNVFVENKVLGIEKDSIYINLEREPTNGKLNLIESYFEESLMTEVWGEIEEKEVANNKVDIVKTKINHHLKKDSYSHDKLFKLCSEINVFELSEKIFDEAVKYMIERDYIKFDNDAYHKLLY